MMIEVLRESPYCSIEFTPGIRFTSETIIDALRAKPEPELSVEQRYARIWHEIVDVEGFPHPMLSFLRDDNDSFPDGYWEIVELRWDPNADERRWRGLTLDAALRRAERDLFSRMGAPK